MRPSESGHEAEVGVERVRRARGGGYRAVSAVGESGYATRMPLLAIMF